MHHPSNLPNPSTSTDQETPSIDFDALFTPDIDFEKQGEVSSGPPSPPIQSSFSGSSAGFPELILDAFDIPDIEGVQEIQHQRKISKKHVQTTLGFPTLLTDQENTITTQKNEASHPEVLSILETESKLYTQRFQEILSSASVNTPEECIKRYAKILLYMLEQFHIHGEKKNQIKFMISLKKVLGECNDEKEIGIYKRNLFSRGYIRPNPELKEELELLYNIYYDGYISSQKELHTTYKQRLYRRITDLEKQLLPYFDPDAPGYDKRNLPQYNKRNNK